MAQERQLISFIPLCCLHLCLLLPLCCRAVSALEVAEDQFPTYLLEEPTDNAYYRTSVFNRVASPEKRRLRFVRRDSSNNELFDDADFLPARETRRLRFVRRDQPTSELFDDSALLPARETRRLRFVKRAGTDEKKRSAEHATGTQQQQKEKRSFYDSNLAMLYREVLKDQQRRQQDQFMERINDVGK